MKKFVLCVLIMSSISKNAALEQVECLKETKKLVYQMKSSLLPPSIFNQLPFSLSSGGRMLLSLQTLK